MADGDIEYITALLHRAAELTLTDPNLPIIRFLEICNEDGYNLLHATVIHKKLEIMELLFEYGTSRYFVTTCLIKPLHTNKVTCLHQSL